MKVNYKVNKDSYKVMTLNQFKDLKDGVVDDFLSLGNHITSSLSHDGT